MSSLNVTVMHDAPWAEGPDNLPSEESLGTLAESMMSLTNNVAVYIDCVDKTTVSAVMGLPSLGAVGQEVVSDREKRTSAMETALLGDTQLFTQLRDVDPAMAAALGQLGQPGWSRIIEILTALCVEVQTSALRLSKTSADQLLTTHGGINRMSNNLMV